MGTEWLSTFFTAIIICHVMPPDFAASTLNLIALAAKAGYFCSSHTQAGCKFAENTYTGRRPHRVLPFLVRTTLNERERERGSMDSKRVLLSFYQSSPRLIEMVSPLKLIEIENWELSIKDTAVTNGLLMRL